MKIPLTYPEFVEFMESRGRKHSEVFGRDSEKVFKISQGLVSSWCVSHEVSPWTGDKKGGYKFSWDHLLRIPSSWVTDSLGVGGFGVVMNGGPGKVEKISYLGFLPQEIKFYKYLITHPISVFPKIYSISENKVVMERLDTHISQIKPLLDRYVRWIPGKIFPSREVAWEKVEKELGLSHWFTRFLKGVESGILEIFGMRSVGDLQAKNIGRRRTGEWVFFDPVAGKILET